MELVTRMMDGSISPEPKGPGRRGFFGFRIGQEEKIDHLQEVGLLSGCTRRQLRSVAKISEIAEMAAGAVLTRVGEPGDQFFLIIDGRARVDVSARRQVRLGPGDYFGEMSLLDGEPRSATVTAETAVRLLVIRRRNFSALLRDIPELTMSLLATLSRRVRQAERGLNA